MSTNNPKIHSFRVISARDAQCINLSNSNSSSLTGTNATDATIAASTTKITKPILMCFICKLSFGNTKSFGLHANSEHTLNLQEYEKILLSREYSSAIIQRNVDERPQISFLEPLDFQKQQNQINKISDESNANIQMGSMVNNTMALNLKNNSDTSSSGKSVHNAIDRQSSPSPQPTNSSRPANTPTPDNCSSLTANSNNKLLNDFLMQQQQQTLNLHRGDRSTPSLLATLQQQQQLLLQQPLGCPDHPTVKGIDCKTCEMLEVSFFGMSGNSGIKSPITPTKSPNSVSNLANSTSPPGSASLTMSPTSQPAPSFTIGACPEHVNGRPFGVECARYV